MSGVPMSISRARSTKRKVPSDIDAVRDSANVHSVDVLVIFVLQVKLWDTTAHRPAMLASKNPKVVSGACDKMKLSCLESAMA